jgi:hypothetical protein
MVFISCTSVSCDFVAGITVVDVDEAESLIGPKSEWYPDKYPCPTCGERCAFSTRKLDERRTQHFLNPMEAFVAFSGAGLPSEDECSSARVRGLLETKRVKSVVTRHIRGTSRCTLDCIELEDGTKLYLGASTHGACVYRVQSPHIYAEGTDEKPRD